MTTVQQAKHALGSEAVLTIVADNFTAGEELLEELWRLIDGFEARFSRFRVDSELTHFNHKAGTEVAVSDPFMKLLQRAKQLSEDTLGLYNPFILPALQQAGYTGSWPNPKSVDKNLDYRERRIHDVAVLQIKHRSARIPADAALDFGGIGKGYLLDELAGVIENRCGGFWISLGGDIMCGGYDEQSQPWQLQVQAAEEPERTVAYVENEKGKRLALATSGITKRGGKKGERSWHHLIDPRTGMSGSTDIMTASVAGPTAAEADVYASCVVLLGSSEGLKFLEKSNFAGLVQLGYSTQYSQSLRVSGNVFNLAVRAGERTV